MKRILVLALGAIMAIACSDDSSDGGDDGNNGNGNGACYVPMDIDLGDGASCIAYSDNMEMTEGMCGQYPVSEHLKYCKSGWKYKCTLYNVETYYYGSFYDSFSKSDLVGECVEGSGSGGGKGACYITYENFDDLKECAIIKSGTLTSADCNEYFNYPEFGEFATYRSSCPSGYKLECDFGYGYYSYLYGSEVTGTTCADWE
ncbi:MAG: hypothetical protein FWC26_03280 [Fibromonadales bacterium]|nr:hypothetical protein [Fibromonadales bacterium]